MVLEKCLVPSEDVSRIYLLLHVVKVSVIAVGDDGLALCLEGVEVVHHLAAEESTAVFKCGFVDDYFSTFCLDTFHYALD